MSNNYRSPIAPAEIDPLQGRSVGVKIESQHQTGYIGVSEQFDYDLVIIGAGVGGHGAALHAVSCGLKTAIIEAGDMGGTCVNRGCIPSKALLAASGRVRELKNAHHLKAMGIQVDNVNFDRAGVAAHASNLVTKLRGDLTNSLTRLNV